MPRLPNRLYIGNVGQSIAKRLSPADSQTVPALAQLPPELPSSFRRNQAGES
jgi:hypothetical protein